MCSDLEHKRKQNDAGIEMTLDKPSLALLQETSVFLYTVNFLNI